METTSPLRYARTLKMLVETRLRRPYQINVSPVTSKDIFDDFGKYVALRHSIPQNIWLTNFLAG